MTDRNKNVFYYSSRAGNTLQFSSLLLAIITIPTLIVILLLPTALAIRANDLNNETKSTTTNNQITNKTNPICATEAMVFAEYQAWHGLPSHYPTPPYHSNDPDVIIRHILSAKAKCIDGFIVDWYGPSAGMLNDEDREFIDDVLEKLLKEAEKHQFKIGIMYDEGTLQDAVDIQAQATSDLIYATNYFTSSAYLTINDHPALFVFPYEGIDAQIDWQTIRQQLPVTVTLIDKDPDPLDLAHDNLFDGFYAWVQPGGVGWKADGTEWGKDYLYWFYNTMKNLYSDKVVVGGVWPGFDDSKASWQDPKNPRYMWRRCGQTWYDTWEIANQYELDYIMIDTWNDFEEGTDIEFGIGECLSPSQTKYAGPDSEIEYIHTLTNSGKFTDTFQLEASSAKGWATSLNQTSFYLGNNLSTTFTVTLTIPPDASRCDQDSLQITATSTISPSVFDTVTDQTILPCIIYLPMVAKPPWQENFDPIQRNWTEVSAKWMDIAGPTAILKENNPNLDYGKVESEVITLDLDTYPNIRIKTTDVNPSSSYTVQINSTDIIVGRTSPTEDVINIAELLGWQGMRSFTINIWVNGEGKSIIFDYIGFEP